MRTLALLLLSTGMSLAVATLPSAPAHAQDGCAKPKKRPSLFGAMGARGLLSNVEGAITGNRSLRADAQETARRAAAQGVDEAATQAGCRAVRTVQSEGAGEAKPAGASAPSQPRETATQRAARESAENDKKYPSRMSIPAEWTTAKEAYDEFGKVRCTGCEGGFAYSGWADWPRNEHSGKYGEEEGRLGRLPIGHVHRWSSNGFGGSLAINSEEQVNGFRCRKMTYRLEKGGKTAERPSLMCWGLENQFDGREGWVMVF